MSPSSLCHKLEEPICIQYQLIPKLSAIPTPEPCSFLKDSQTVAPCHSQTVPVPEKSRIVSRSFGFCQPKFSLNLCDNWKNTFLYAEYRPDPYYMRMHYHSDDHSAVHRGRLA